MSLILYNPSSQLSAGLKCEIVAKVCGVELQVNNIPKDQWKSPEHLKRHPLGKIPVLQTPQGFIYQSNTICRYIARKAGKLYGATPIETALIDQWLEFVNTQVQPLIKQTIYFILGKVNSTPERYAEAKKVFVEVLKIVDAHLAKNQFLGKSISIADYVLACVVRFPMRILFPESVRNEFPALTKWFVNIMNQEVFTKTFGKVFLCEKDYVPDFEFFNKMQAAKKEQQKKQAAEKKQKQAAQKKKKQEQAKLIAQAEALAAAQKKKKNPLDELPKSSFVLDDFKRDFVNAQDRAEAFKRFWAAYDAEGWSLWKSDYELYDGQGKVGYLTCNLKNGFIRNLEHFRKYAFGVLGVYGDEGDLIITGTWLWRGTQIPQEWIDHNAYDYFKFEKLDHNNEAHRKMIEQSWTNIEQGSYQGRPVYEAKWFK